MTKVAVTEQYLTDIADAIRAKNGTSGGMTPADMASAISDIPSGGGGSSPWTHIIRAEYTVSTTSTSRGTVATLSCGTDVWTSSKIVYVRIRDTAGAREGHFVGTDSFYVNARPANGSVASTAASELLCSCTKYADGVFTTYCGSGSGAYGVFPYTMYSNGRIQISRRYNSSNSLTIDGTYSVDVFTLDYPEGYPSPFVV